jgi:hypothetical protein
VLPFDMEAGRRLAMNSVAKARALGESSLLGSAQRWATIDYLHDEDASDVSADLAFPIARNATLHGFACWFDSVLCEDITLTNRPAEGGTLYSRAFFPLESPISVTTGDVVSLQLRATRMEDYIWSWTTLVSGGDGTKKAAFTQSTFFGQPGLAR